MKTGDGDAVMERERSGLVALSTRTVVVVALFCGTLSTVCEVALAELTMVVPAAVPALTETTKVKFATMPFAPLVVFVQVTVPVPPTAGVTQVHPAGAVMLTKVVLGGVDW